MFFKELACLYCLVINVHLVAVRSRVSFVRLSRLANFVNNFFYFFKIFFSHLCEDFKTEKEGFEPSRRY